MGMEWNMIASGMCTHKNVNSFDLLGEYPRDHLLDPYQ